MRAWLVLVAACTGATPDPGLGAMLQVPGAQFRPGPFPAPTGGPDAGSLVTTHPSVVIGRLHEKLHGILDGAARAAIVGVAGVDGAWIVPAGPPDVDTPGSATVTSLFGLARATTPGPFELVVAATDDTGRIGTPASVALVAEPDAPPTGDLVIRLAWSGAADLDLHVVDPLDHEAWSGSPNTWQPPTPGEPSDPCAFDSGGILDRDANAGCTLDGAPAEDVVWTTRMCGTMAIAPVIPPGEYVVRVDTRAMCGDASASWYATATFEGTLVAAARGVATADDLQPPPVMAGAGLTALRFTLP